MVRWHVLATGDAVHLHARVVLEVREQLWCDEKVLRGVLGTGNIDNPGVNQPIRCQSESSASMTDSPFVAWVHALVDLVNNAERGARQALQCHEIEYGRHGPLASRLPVRVQD